MVLVRDEVVVERPADFFAAEVFERDVVVEPLVPAAFPRAGDAAFFCAGAGVAPFACLAALWVARDRGVGREGSAGSSAAAPAPTKDS